MWLLISSVLSETCEWFGSSYGYNIYCLQGWVAKGVCGSGRTEDCKSADLELPYSYMLKCCQTKKQGNGQTNCSNYPGDYGESTICPGNNQAIYGGCGSGMNHDCTVNGKSYVSMMECCENQDLSVNMNGDCAWQYSSYGKKLECKSGYVMVGQCQSGGRADCKVRRSKEYVGLYCCPYSE